MKKSIRLIGFFLLTYFAFMVNVSAAPVTYERTIVNLRLPSDVDTTKVNMEEVLRVPAVVAKAKIYDFADLLTEAEETKIYIQLNEYIKNTGLDAAIVLTNDLAGFAMNDYIYNFYDYNDFKDNGITFLIYVNDTQKVIYMGNNGPRTSEVFTAYTDARISEILKYVYQNYIEKEDYVGACENFVILVDGFYVKSFGSYRVGDEGDLIKDFPWVAVILVSISLSFIIVVLLITKFQKIEKRPDLTIKKGINSATMVVKCEYDKPVSNKPEVKS